MLLILTAGEPLGVLEAERRRTSERRSGQPGADPQRIFGLLATRGSHRGAEEERRRSAGEPSAVRVHLQKSSGPQKLPGPAVRMLEDAERAAGGN